MNASTEIPPARPDPIFVVGAARSGTALTRSLLNNHPTIHLSGETHHFDDLRPRMRGHEAQLADSVAMERCEDYFLALTHRPYGHRGDPSQGTMSRLALRAEASGIGGTDGYFQAFCVLRAAAHGKQRWGEKTPRHVYRIPEILERFPRAQVIVMVRDPRAVVASYRDWRSQGGFDLEADPGHAHALEADERRARLSYHIVTQSLLWRSSVTAALRARDRFGPERVRIVRYEDLIDDPARLARELFGWLGTTFSEELLDVPIHNSSFSAFDPHGGFRPEALERWREKLSRREVGNIQSVCRSAMRACAYPPEPGRASVATLAGAYLSLVPAVVRATLANRERIVNLPSYVWRRARALW